MSDCGTCAKRCRYAYRLGELLIGSSGLPRFVCVNMNAVRALCGERYRQRHQLLVLARDSPWSQCRFVEFPKCFENLWSLCLYVF